MPPGSTNSTGVFPALDIATATITFCNGSVNGDGVGDGDGVDDGDGDGVCHVDRPLRVFCYVMASLINTA